jgi:hypothetical protein
MHNHVLIALAGAASVVSFDKKSITNATADKESFHK